MVSIDVAAVPGRDGDKPSGTTSDARGLAPCSCMGGLFATRSGLDSLIVRATGFEMAARDTARVLTGIYVVVHEYEA